MSFEAMAWAAKVKTQTPTQKLILLLLADRSGDLNTCFPSITRIAEDACMSRSGVIENIKKLSALGFIEVTKRQVLGGDQKGYKSNLYRINIDSFPLGTSKPKKVVNYMDMGSQLYGLGVVHEVDPNLSVESINEPLVEAHASADTESSNKKPLPPEAHQYAEKVAAHVLRINPKQKTLQPNKRAATVRSWAESFDKLNRIDGRDWSEIGRVLSAALSDSFWGQNILSGGKFRDKFDVLFVKFANNKPSTLPDPMGPVTKFNI